MAAKIKVLGQKLQQLSAFHVLFGGCLGLISYIGLGARSVPLQPYAIPICNEHLRGPPIWDRTKHANLSKDTTY